MKAKITIDTREFQAALRDYIEVSKSELADIVGRRMAFLLMRVFASMSPKSPSAAAARLRRRYTMPVGERRFDKKIGKKVSRGRALQVRHLIIQAKRAKEGKPGLYGAEMKKEAGKFLGKATRGVGYLKSFVAEGIRQLRGSFTQYGFNQKLKLKLVGMPRRVKSVDGNAALIKFAAQYGAVMENISIKGARQRTVFTKKPQPSANPTAEVDLGVPVRDGQESNVSIQYEVPFRRAYYDETVEMRAEIARRMQDVSNAFMVPELRRAA